MVSTSICFAATEAPPLLERPVPPPQPIFSSQMPSAAKAETRSYRGPLASYFWMGPGVAVYSGENHESTHSGKVGFAVNGGAAYQIMPDRPIYVGADLGLNFWNFDPSRNGMALNALGIQLLPTALYRFHDLLTPGVSLYIGASAGPHLYIVQSKDATGSDSGSLMKVYLEILIRPGIVFDVARDLSFGFESKFGILRSELIFLPHLVANLSL